MLHIVVPARGVHTVPAWEPDPGLSFGRIMEADGAVRKVARLTCMPFGLGTVDVPGRAVLPDSCGRAQPFKSTGNVLVGDLSRPREATPEGGPTVVEVNPLRGVNDVVDVAVLGLEEVNTLPLLQRECDRSVGPNAGDEVRPEEPPDRSP